MFVCPRAGLSDSVEATLWTKDESENYSRDRKYSDPLQVFHSTPYWQKKDIFCKFIKQTEISHGQQELLLCIEQKHPIKPWVFLGLKRIFTPGFGDTLPSYLADLLQLSDSQSQVSPEIQGHPELFLRHSFVILVVRLGSLSCWQVNRWPSVRSWGLRTRFSSRISVLCCFHLSFSCNQSSCACSQNKHSHVSLFFCKFCWPNLFGKQRVLWQTPHWLSSVSTWLLSGHSAIKPQLVDDCSDGLSGTFSTQNLWRSATAIFGFLVTSLTKALMPWLLSLAGQPGRVLVVPNFHVRVMEATVLSGTLGAAEVQIPAIPKFWLFGPFFQLHDLHLLWYALWAVRSYIDRCVSFLIKSNCFN